MQNTQSYNFSVIAFRVLSFFMVASGTAIADTTVTVDRAVHVTTAEGSDLVLDVGDYVLEPAQQWLRITPSEGNAVDAHLIEAQTGTHKESLESPQSLSVTGIEADTHHLVLLLPDGKSFAAHGSYSGIRSRGRTRIDIKRILALAAKRKKAPRTEYATPIFGGSGGNRSYNLDCGNGAVLVGAVVKGGLWLDALGIICQRVVSQTGALGDEFTRGPVGGSGGDALFSRCRNGKVVAGIKAFSGQFMNGMLLFCGQWDPSNKTASTSSFLTQTCINERKCIRIGRTLSSQGGSAIHSPFHCPSGKVGKAFRGKHGIYVDSTKFVCDFWNK